MRDKSVMHNNMNQPIVQGEGLGGPDYNSYSKVY